MQKTCIRNPFLDVFSESKIDQGEASIVLALYKNPVWFSKIAIFQYESNHNYASGTSDRHTSNKGKISTFDVFVELECAKWTP